MYANPDDRTVRMIVARGTKIPFRICKNCEKKIPIGELCVRYKRRHRCVYHCYDCAQKLNPLAVEEYHNNSTTTSVSSSSSPV